MWLAMIARSMKGPTGEEEDVTHGDYFNGVEFHFSEQNMQNDTRKE